MPITRTLTPATTGRVKFATSTAPRPPLADLVSNPIPTRTTRARKDVVGCRAEAEQRRTNRRWLILQTANAACVANDWPSSDFWLLASTFEIRCPHFDAMNSFRNHRLCDFAVENGRE